MHKNAKIWIEAMRLRTLPVSVAGVLTAIGFARLAGPVRWLPAMLCLAFAVLAQIASNFANEYYDFRDGLDRPGREGPRRGVTEGDITPRAMLTATFVALGTACAVGLSLVGWGSWKLIPAGIVIAAGALAYSTGPYPLSRHGLGEVAVIFFFGLIPVNLTYFILTGSWSTAAAEGSIAMGLLGAMVLMVNNYRDADDDRAVGKRTIAVIFGRQTIPWLYIAAGITAMLLISRHMPGFSVAGLNIPLCAIGSAAVIDAGLTLRKTHGAKCTRLLALTSILMFVTALVFTVSAFCHGHSAMS